MELLDCCSHSFTHFQIYFFSCFIDFYHNTENLDPFTFDGMEWQKIFQTLTKKVYTAVVACLRTYRTEAATQLKTIKDDGHAKIYAEMSKRFRQFEWFVLDLPSSGLVSNTKVDLIHKSK